MRAIPTGQRVRARLAAVAATAAVLIAAAACTTATAGPSDSQSHSQSPTSHSQSPTSPSQGQGTGLVVTTAGGAVHGKAVAATDEFLGIPYAAPPVGALRWQPPAAGRPLARHPAGRQLRPALPAAVVTVRRQPGASEDCLYLNVFAPARSPCQQPARDGLGARRLAAYRRKR